MTLENKVAQMLLAGFTGQNADDGSNIDQLIRDGIVANFILFSRNVANIHQIHSLCKELTKSTVESAGIEPLIAIDQEGGIVTRLRSGATFFPGAMASAAAGSLEDVKSIGRAMGEELLALGVNVNLAPVADVNCNPANPVIGVRSYGETPERVADFAAAYAAGLAESGVAATAKHFPGHGDTDVDSHLGLTRVPHSMDRLERIELLPFRRLIDDEVPLIMTAHVMFPALDDGPYPATLSRAILTGYLRERLGFRGIIVTDCLEMKAIADHYTDAAVLAVEAGADLLCLSSDPDLQRRAHADIVQAVRSGRIDEARIDAAVGRILDLKRRFFSHPLNGKLDLSIVNSNAHRDLASRVARSSLTLVHNNGAFPARSGTVYIDVEPRALTGADEGAGGRNAATALHAFGPGKIETVSAPLNPSDGDIQRLRAIARGKDVVVGTYNAVFYAGQRALVDALTLDAHELGKKCAIVALRLPYDATVFPKVDGILLAYEYSPPAVRAVASFLAGVVEARGSSPVSLN